jgi:uncharacterized protein YjbI with pentapeptide repeats
MPVILQNELAEYFAQHDRYLRGVSGGKRLDLSMQTGHELDFSKKNLTGAEFVGSFLNYANFSYSNLQQANFFGATMNNGNYIEADLSQADMRGAQMQFVNFTNAILNDANLSDGLLLRHQHGGGLGPVHTGDSKLRLSDAIFRNVTAQRAKFSSAIELSTNLSFANFKGAKLNGVNFAGSNLHGVTFENADLRGCNFSNADMSSVILLRANCDGAVFDGADLTASLVHTEEFSATTFSHAAKMTRSLESLEYSIKEIIADHRVWVNTLGREGKRADLIGLDLSNVNLDGVQLQAASLQKSLLSKASFEGGIFTMSDLSYCNARDASFVKADCRGINFSTSRLDHANLQYANFSPMPISRSVDPTFWPANFSGSNMQSARLRGSDLSGANLERTLLAGADLRDTNLDGACLIDANATGADFRGAKLDKADLRGAVGVR